MCTILVNTFIPLWWICFGIPWFPWSNARNWTNSAMIRSLKLFMQSPSVHLYILHCKQISHVHITCIFCTICISADLLTICKNNFANTNKSNKMIIKIFLNWSIKQKMTIMMLKDALVITIKNETFTVLPSNRFELLEQASWFRLHELKWKLMSVIYIKKSFS